jgi:hypothetical protein
MATFIRPLYALAFVLAAVGITRAGEPAGKAEAPKHLPADRVVLTKE